MCDNKWCFWDDWTLDSVCSFHIYVNKELFNRYKSYDDGYIVMENGSKNKVLGMVIMKMEMFDRVV